LARSPEVDELLSSLRLELLMRADVTPGMVGSLETLLHRVASSPAEYAHWVFGADDNAHDYCLACVEKRVAELQAQGEHEAGVDGGWCIEHDAAPECATCHVRLDGTFTEYAAEELIKVLAELPYEDMTAEEAYDLWRALNVLQHEETVSPELAEVCWFVITFFPDNL